MGSAFYSKGKKEIHKKSYLKANVSFLNDMKFVLMIPLRRCGSNAIRVRMNLHPDFYSPYPLHLCDLLKDNGRVYSDDEIGHFQMVVDLVGLQRHSLVPWEGIVFDPIDIYKSVRNKPRSFHQIYWEMLFRMGKAQNA